MGRAADFPECLEIVARGWSNLESASGASLMDLSSYEESMPQKVVDLRGKTPGTLRGDKLAESRVCKGTHEQTYVRFAILETGIVFDQTTPVFPFTECSSLLCCSRMFMLIGHLSSGANLETRPRYTPSDCF